MTTELIEKKTWDDFDFKENLLRGIYCMGFEKPSVIQQKAIYPMITKHDIIAQAQSGTGKTGTFSISALQLIDETMNETQAIIISPTHELSSQIYNVVCKLGSFMDNFGCQLFIGGVPVQDDVHKIKEKRPQIAVGTSGRIHDLLKKNIIRQDHLKLIILDEADSMLSFGFKEQIYNIFQFLPEQTQVALFSASMPDDVLELSKKFMREPIRLVMKAEELNLECIQQYYVALQSDDEKYSILKKLFEYCSVSQCIIYVNSIPRVERLFTAMLNDGFSVCCIHSSMNKDVREENFSIFKNGKCRVLISSNITARGIDVQQVRTVINFDIPSCVHTYLHRIGRSGRWGRKGVAINFITKRDLETMKNIEKFYKSNIEELPINDSLYKLIN